jgi:hypothetical protein
MFKESFIVTRLSFRQPLRTNCTALILLYKVAGNRSICCDVFFFLFMFSGILVVCSATVFYGDSFKSVVHFVYSS